MKVTRNELALFVFWRGELSPEEAVLYRDGYRLLVRDGKDAILLKDGIPVEDKELEVELDYRAELLLREECQQLLREECQQTEGRFARSIPLSTDGHNKYVSRFGGMTFILETYPA